MSEQRAQRAPQRGRPQQRRALVPVAETAAGGTQVVPTPETAPRRAAPSAPVGRRRRVSARILARIASVLGPTGRDESEFHPGQLAIDERPRSPIHGQIVLACVSVVAAGLAWSIFGRLASYTEAAGRIQTVGRTRVLEALSSGKVIKINAVDGSSVSSGEALVELDPTEALAARTIVDQKLTDVRAETMRLRVEIAAARADTIDPRARIAWPDEIPAFVRRREDGVARADLAKLAAQIATLRAQRTQKEVERDKFAHDIEAQKALVAVTQENMDMVASLTRSGYNSEAKFLDMKAQLDDQKVKQTSDEGSLEHAKQAILMIDSEIAKTRESFVSTATQTVSTNEQAIVDLAQQVVRANQTLTNMTLRASVAGVIHASAVTTIGQVVKGGQQLMQIVPRDAPLEIQAYVSNTDIGFIRKGDPATVKITAFSYKTYGWLDGSVIDLSNDALPLQGKEIVQTSSLDGEYRSTSTAQKTGNLQYPVTIRTNRSTMSVDGKEIPLTPGMAVTVEILTENRRAIDYVLSPLEELFSTAGHEQS